jgi:outer membrane protein TolC
MYRILVASIFILSALLPAPALSESGTWEPPALSAMIEEGLEHNQDIQSLQARVEAARELIPFAGSLEDPRLGFGLLNLPTDTFDFNQEPMTQKQISLAQKVPWFGKRHLRSQLQSLEAHQQMSILEGKKLELARKITADYYELGLIAKSLEINSRLQGMVNQLLRVAETKYASGVGLQQDVLQAQVELSKLLDEEIVLEKKHRTVEDRINALLNRESFASLPAPESPAFPDGKLSVKTLRDLALKENPWLKAKLAEINQAGVEIELAKKDYWPDMDFKVAYGQREDSQMGQDRADFLSGAVVFKIPLWQKNRQDKKFAASKRKLEAALRSHRNFAQTLPHKVNALVTEIMKTQKNYRLYADALMLQAEQWAHASLTAYEVGKVNFNTMINAQIRLLRFELRAEQYLFQIFQKRAELKEIVGGHLVGLSSGDDSASDEQEKLVTSNNAKRALKKVSRKYSQREVR